MPLQIALRLDRMLQCVCYIMTFIGTCAPKDNTYIMLLISNKLRYIVIEAIYRLKPMCFSLLQMPIFGNNTRKIPVLFKGTESLIPMLHETGPLNLFLLEANFANTKCNTKLKNNWNPGIWVLIWEY